MENTFTRTGGLTAWARVGERPGNGNVTTGWGANFRNSFIDNYVAEGNHVWNYNTRPNSAEDPAMADYFPVRQLAQRLHLSLELRHAVRLRHLDHHPIEQGGSKTIEAWFFGSLTNDREPHHTLS